MKSACSLKYCAVLLAVATVGCARSNEEGFEYRNFALTKVVRDESDHKADIEPTSDSFDLLRLAIGGGVDGYSVLDVKGDGAVVYVFRDRDAEQQRGGKALVVRRATFTMSATEVAELLEQVDSVNFLNLEKEYFASVHDGTHIYLRLTADEFDKSVYCHNHFPAEVQRLVTYCKSQIIAPHVGDFKSAEEIDGGLAQIVRDPRLEEGSD